MGPFVAGMVLGRPKRIVQCERVPFSGSGSTRETKMSSEEQSETCSLVLVTLECVQARLRLPFIYSWTGHLGSPVGNEPTNVRGVPQLK
ncbi:hypothetical protein CRG98_022852 [Punica granatum]|uniref:Uncharacterized protein n=1 Tax=Punica granatum TaxID=22663 RepID=A0A2I0JKG1_PUNGR|nr:hypothetical protein CRG98_022852 [Punica granatum]